jgi:hypothetical protein
VPTTESIRTVASIFIWKPELLKFATEQSTNIPPYVTEPETALRNAAEALEKVKTVMAEMTETEKKNIISNAPTADTPLFGGVSNLYSHSDAEPTAFDANQTHSGGATLGDGSTHGGDGPQEINVNSLIGPMTPEKMAERLAEKKVFDEKIKEQHAAALEAFIDSNPIGYFINHHMHFLVEFTGWFFSAPMYMRTLASVTIQYLVRRIYRLVMSFRDGLIQGKKWDAFSYAFATTFEWEITTINSIISIFTSIKLDKKNDEKEEQLN